MIMEVQKKTGASIRKICQVLDLPRSSFYQAAVSLRSITPIFHSDRGSQYGYLIMPKMLKRKSLNISMVIITLAVSIQLLVIRPQQLFLSSNSLCPLKNQSSFYSGAFAPTQTPPEDARVQGGRVESPFLIN